MEDPWLVPLQPNTGPQLVSERVRGFGKYLVTPGIAKYWEVWLA